MSFAKKIVLLIIATVLILTVLVVLLVHSVQQDVSEGGNAGLFPPANTPTPTASTEEKWAQREEREKSKEVLSAEVAESLEEEISQYVSRGDFASLDSWLHGLELFYKDDQASQDASKMELIDLYRADIAYFNGIQEVSAPIWGFYNPDMVAAAYAYGTIESKYLAVMDERSAILPKATGNIELHASAKVPAEVRADLDAINLGRSKNGQFKFLQIWDMTIQGMDCEMLVVANEDYLWRPYTLRAKDGHRIGLTAGDCRDLKREESTIDLDATILS